MYVLHSIKMESSFARTYKTNIEFISRLPGRERLVESLGFRPEKILLVYDKRLLKHEMIAKWIKGFPLGYPVTAGEGLKDLGDLASHVKKIFKLVGPFSTRSLAVVGLGGGSVGDFAGFLSSILKRGLPLIQIPTTLLAAMDSAHGGKTALNLGGVKNQIGTFYPADSVLLVRSLFEGLPPLQIQSAAGELAKMALLTGGTFYEKFQSDFKMEVDSIWNFLPETIAAKYKIVEQDPFEKQGLRQVLNLGHTLGHVLESYFALPHGIAVGQGSIFALLWSAHQGHLRRPVPLLDLLSEKAGFKKPREFAKAHRLMSRSRLARYLADDKKLTDTRHLTFIFMEDVGKPFPKVVTLESFLTETQRQGWTSV